MLLKVVCLKCGNELIITTGLACNLSCRKCGSFKHELQSTETTKAYFKCQHCGDFLDFPTNTPVDLFHDKPKCKSPILILTTEEEIKTQEGGYDAPVKIVVPKTAQYIPPDKTDVTAVVVCHNRLDLTKECIAHIRKSNKHMDIVLVDNNSTDDTSKWVHDELDITYVRNNMNIGCGMARNQGAAWVKTPYILFLDNDQYIASDSLQKLINANADLAGVDSWKVSQVTCTSERSTGLVKEGYIGSGGLLVKKDVFTKLGGYDERFAPAWYEDADFCMRAKYNGFKVVHVKDTKIRHIGGQTTEKQKDYNSDTAKVMSRELFRSIWSEYLFKNHRFPNIAKPIDFTFSRPKIAILADVQGWAWDNKARQLANHLSNEFGIIVYYAQDGGIKIPTDFDLYFTFEPNFYDGRTPIERTMTGVTAHTYTNMPGYQAKLQHCIAIHANSQILYEELRKFNPNTYYVPNGVDETQFKYVERSISQPFTVGYVGKDKPGKGLSQYIVPACEKAGVKLKSLAAKYHSTNKVDHTKMPEWYTDIDCVLIASDMDGTPNQLLEAAAVGRTFVGNRIGNVPEFCEEGVNGFMVDRNVDSYVEKLLWLKNNRKSCKNMGINARKTVENNWTWRTQSENYRVMFRYVLNKLGMK